MSKRIRTVRPARTSLLLAILLTPPLAAACSSSGSSSTQEPTKPAVDPDPAAAATLPQAPDINVTAAASDASSAFPLDATPSPDGKNVYYIALAEDAEGDRLASVFRTTAEGGGAISTVSSGAPLASPVGITSSIDGSTLFVADPGTAGGGAVLAIPEGGGAASVVSGTAGYRPQGITVAEVEKRIAIYFTGFDPSSGEAGLFSVDPSGGEITAVAVGAPFGSPGGVTVTKSGEAFVADASSEQNGAAVIKVADGTASVFVRHIGVGFPAGITSTTDDSTVLVSGLDPATHTDAVYFVNASTGELSVLTKTIEAYHSPAGVHRAHDTDVFAWADSRAKDKGTVYVLTP